MIALAVLSAGLLGQSAPGLDRTIESFRSENAIPGMAVVIMRGGQVIYSRGFGYADVAGRVPFRDTTQCRIGSVSKGLTAMGIANLVEMQKLKLSDKAVARMPEVLAKAAMQGDARWAEVTVEHLLLHRSGLDGYKSDILFCDGARAQRELGLTELAAGSTLIRWGLRERLKNDPGTQYEYSNLGYAMLARIIEEASSKSYEGFMTEAVFSKAGARSFVIGNYRPTALLPNEARYYSGKTGRAFWQASDEEVDLAYGWDLRSGDGAGGWVCTAIDLARVLDSFTAGKIIRRDTFDLFFSKVDGVEQSRAGWALGRGPDGRIQVFNGLGVVMGGNFAFAEWKHGYTITIVANHMPAGGLNVLELEGAICRAIGI